MYLKEGTLLQGGTYKVIRFIKSGGFGCTYEAVHQLLNKRVAIKEFFVKDFCNREETGSITVGTLSKVTLVERLKQKFISEASSLSALDHEGIVNVSNLFLENDTAYYVMDYIDGCSLDVYVQQNGPLSEAVALDYIGQACDALKYVHEKNILHLDIKPGNLMLDKDGKVTLIDFGTSKQYDECDGENTSTLLGNTPGYAPPEQSNSKVTIFTPATDVYSLGATLYKLLTGITPPTSSERSSGEELDPLPGNISQTTAEAIMKAMILNKKERLQSVGEFQSMLVLKAVDGTPSVDEKVTVVSQSDECDDRTVYMGGDAEASVVVDEPMEPAAEPSVEPELPLTKKPRRWLWWVLVALIIVGVVVFAVMPSKTGGRAEQPEKYELTPDEEVCTYEILLEENALEVECFVESESAGEDWELTDTAAYEAAIPSEHGRSLTGTHKNHEWVDLGLSVKWATRNVGASTPGDYGNYYAWGETRTKSEYWEDNCSSYRKSWGDIGGNSSRDAARANWGGSWRMPTKAEFQELKDNCTWTRTTQNGHKGYKVTSKKNGQSIFLPAAGYRDGGKLYFDGEYGFYWSSAPYESGTDSAYNLCFFEDSQGVGWFDRDGGQSVRPVLEDYKLTASDYGFI